MTPAALSRTAVFEPSQVPAVRAVSSVRTTTVHHREPVASEGEKRRFSSVVLGGFFGALLGLTLLVFGPTEQEAPQPPAGFQYMSSVAAQ
ncbi:hypothetical protein C1Y63_11005 [Corynebacterium sp. 13CS0277]|nr:hypothetical protein C1Y63_11005 [Corynebacterium sp. 13CS0277]